MQPALAPQQEPANGPHKSKRLQSRLGVQPLQLSGSISNRQSAEPQEAALQNRCVGNPQNYCFPYYFPLSFQLALQQNPHFLQAIQPAKGKLKSTTDQTPIVVFNRGGDKPPEVFIDIIYSQQRDGEVSFEFNPRTGRLSFLTFIDISSLYNDKQMFAY